MDKPEAFLVGIFAVAIAASLSLLSATLAIIIQKNEDIAALKQELAQVKKISNSSIQLLSSKLEEELEKLKAQKEHNLQQVNSDIAGVAQMTKWFKASDGCFYKVFTSSQNYATSTSNCQKFGGTLIAKGLRNATVIEELINAHVLATNKYYWIGYSDEEEEGNWTWIDGGVTVNDIVAWSQRQPDNKNNEDCAEIVLIESLNVYLNDQTCTQTRDYVCEIKLPSVF